MPIVEIKRPQIDYSQLGALAGQAINPQAQMMEKLLPLLLQAHFKQKIEEKTPAHQLSLAKLKDIIKKKERFELFQKET